MIRRSVFIAMLLAAAGASAQDTTQAAQAGAAASAQPTAEQAATPAAPAAPKVDIIDNVVGKGKEAVPGKTVVVHYTGWFYKPLAARQRGRKFDSSLDRGQPLDFPLGAGRVIKGWDQGVAGMKVGGQRTLVIPPALAYGERGAGGVIPPNATLIFDVELLDVK
jgi:FKBP-type peptidyl-prolyl cis-trans isomerase FkpA